MIALIPSPITSTVVRFQGQKEQQGMLDRFNKMHGTHQDVLRRIYTLAQNDQSRGQHIAYAMFQAMKHRCILHWASKNFYWRLRLREAEKAKDEPTINRFQEKIEDFHIALMAFVLGIPLEDAQTRWQQKPPASEEFHTAVVATLGNTHSPPEGPIVGDDQFIPVVRAIVDESPVGVTSILWSVRQSAARTPKEKKDVRREQARVTRSPDAASAVNDFTILMRPVVQKVQGKRKEKKP